MSNALKLPHAMDKCPSAWINFFEECCITGPRDHTGDVTVDHINNQLSRWHGRYDESTTSLVFENEQYLTWYLLRWT